MKLRGPCKRWSGTHRKMDGRPYLGKSPMPSSGKVEIRKEVQVTENIYKEGSKLHAVYAVYLKDGVEAAFKHGIETLGMSPSTMKIQSKRWGLDGSAPKVATPKKKKERPEVKVPAKDQKYFTLGPKGVRMCMIKDPGEQQTVVRWLDTNQEQAVPNSWLHPAVARVKGTS